MMAEMIIGVLLIASALFAGCLGMLYKVYSKLYKAIKYDKYGYPQAK